MFSLEKIFLIRANFIRDSILTPFHENIVLVKISEKWTQSRKVRKHSLIPISYFHSLTNFSS